MILLDLYLRLVGSANLRSLPCSADLTIAEGRLVCNDPYHHGNEVLLGVLWDASSRFLVTICQNVLKFRIEGVL